MGILVGILSDTKLVRFFSKFVQISWNSPFLMFPVLLMRQYQGAASITLNQ